VLLQKLYQRSIAYTGFTISLQLLNKQLAYLLTVNR